MRAISALMLVLAVSQVFGSGKQAALKTGRTSMLQSLSALTSKQLSLCSDAVAATDVLLSFAKGSGDSVPYMTATNEACDDIPEAGADSIIEIIAEMYDALELDILVGITPNVDVAAQVVLSWVDQAAKIQEKASSGYIKEVNSFKAKYPKIADLKTAADAGIKASSEYTAAVKQFNTDLIKAVSDLKAGLA